MMFGKSALLGGVMMAAMACAAPASAAAPVASAEQGTIAARSDGIEVRRGDTLMRVTALTDDILRVRIARGGTFPEDASWAVLPAMRAAAVKVAPAADGFATGAVNVHVDPATLALTITDRAGKVISADAAHPLSFDGTAFTLNKRLPITEIVVDEALGYPCFVTHLLQCEPGE